MRVSDVGRKIKEDYILSQEFEKFLKRRRELREKSLTWQTQEFLKAHEEVLESFRKRVSCKELGL
ncbi:MAG: hypothetical protein ACE5K0_05690 [Candidatus Methanofastidiosia archaeon]